LRVEISTVATFEFAAVSWAGAAAGVAAAAGAVVSSAATATLPSDEYIIDTANAMRVGFRTALVLFCI
jgi:hypothetical protein